MEVWGITGVIGSGKSTAIAHIKELGHPVIDADQVSRIVVERDTEDGKEGFAAIYKAFGSTVLDKTGKLDRTALRKRMMTNPHERELLEGILHPRILAHIQKKMRQWKDEGAAFGFVEGSRLIESGFHDMCSGLILVGSSEANRIKRVMKRDSMGKEEVTMMMGLQDEHYMKRVCKIHWINDGKLPDFYKQIDAFIATRLAKK
jgi:dephospho-CoA kinase